MTSEQVDKLITFGQMALEQGWYEQAREYFQQALALAPSNREAMKGLARANEVLSRRMPTAVEPTRAEPVEPPRKVSIEPTKPEVEPAKPERADQLVSMLEGKRRWVALAVVPVLLLAVVFAYQRAQAPPAPTFENWSYLRAAEGALGTCSRAYSQLANPDPRLFKTWESHISNAFSMFRLCGEEIRELQPPSQCARIHKDLVQMVVHFEQALDLYEESQYGKIDEKMFEAEQEFEAALKYMRLASDKIEQALK